MNWIITIIKMSLLSLTVITPLLYFTFLIGLELNEFYLKMEHKINRDLSLRRNVNEN